MDRRELIINGNDAERCLFMGERDHDPPDSDLYFLNANAMQMRCLSFDFWLDMWQWRLSFI